MTVFQILSKLNEKEILFGKRLNREGRIELYRISTNIALHIGPIDTTSLTL